MPVPVPAPPALPTETGWPIGYATVEETAAAIIKAGRIRRGEIPPEPTSIAEVDTVARMIIDAGRRVRGEIE